MCVCRRKGPGKVTYLVGVGGGMVISSRNLGHGKGGHSLLLFVHIFALSASLKNESTPLKMKGCLSIPISYAGT